jgi:hypothetical protein
MHRDLNQDAVAAAIRRADLRLRRALVVHLPDLLWAIAINNQIDTSVKRGLIQRADRRLRAVCAAAFPEGPAARARRSAERALRDAKLWTRDSGEG